VRKEAIDLPYARLRFCRDLFVLAADLSRNTDNYADFSSRLWAESPCPSASAQFCNDGRFAEEVSEIRTDRVGIPTRTREALSIHANKAPRLSEIAGIVCGIRGALETG
jgi:hypothetical protein